MKWGGGGLCRLNVNFTWNRHGSGCFLFKNLVQHELKDVGEVGEMGAGTGYLKGVATETGHMYVEVVNIIIHVYEF